MAENDRRQNEEKRIRIVPRDEAKGTDFCGQRSDQFIIRSDLRCCMKAYHVRDGDIPVKIYPLHPTCAGGDHYMATPKHFYIIKGNKCRKVTDLYRGADPETFQLHPDCQGGLFYMAKDSDNFFIITYNSQESKYDCKHVTNLKDGKVKNSDQQILGKYKFSEADIGSRYYWATTGYLYFLNPITTWSLEYHRTKDLFKDPEKCNDFPVYPPITAFLPGGLAVIMGQTFGRWEQLKSIQNKAGENPLPVQLTIIRKQGYKTPTAHFVQHGWSISHKGKLLGLTVEEIFKAALKQTFCLNSEYGGFAVDTTKEDWSEETEVDEKLTGIVPSKGSLYIWQYVLGIGDQVVLYTKHVEETNSASAPQNSAGQILVPLPTAQQ